MSMLKNRLAMPFMLVFLSTGVVSAQPGSKPIQHDAEHYMLLAQHGDKWAREDVAIAAKLEAVRNANDGKRPSVLRLWTM